MTTPPGQLLQRQGDAARSGKSRNGRQRRKQQGRLAPLMTPQLLETTRNRSSRMSRTSSQPCMELNRWTTSHGNVSCSTYSRRSRRSPGISWLGRCTHWQLYLEQSKLCDKHATAPRRCAGSSSGVCSVKSCSESCHMVAGAAMASCQCTLLPSHAVTSSSLLTQKSPFNTIPNQSQFQCFSRPCASFRMSSILVASIRMSSILVASIHILASMRVLSCSARLRFGAVTPKIPV